MENLLEGKRVLISGGSRGIGKAIARFLLEKKAKVLIFARHIEDLNATKEELKNLGEINIVMADNSKIEDVKKVFRVIDDIWGGIDILINNAGLPASGIQDMTREEIEYLLASNLNGYIYCAKEAIERMKKGGHIVNIGSLSSKTLDGRSNVYNPAKSGVDGFDESIRKHFNSQNIKVTLISPGSVATGIHGISEVELDRYRKNLEMLEPADIAEAVYFCLNQPWRSDIINLQIKPRNQIL